MKDFNNRIDFNQLFFFFFFATQHFDISKFSWSGRFITKHKVKNNIIQSYINMFFVLWNKNGMNIMN